MRTQKRTFEALLAITCIALSLSSCSKKKSDISRTVILHREKYEATKLANGAIISAKVEPLQGTNNAILTADTATSYKLDLTLHVAIPTPATTIKDLSAATPELTRALPNIETMISKSEASPFYKTLYENKVSLLEHQISYLGQLLPRDTLYDCQTILSITNQINKQNALLVQAIMNVNTDGSDGDRNIPLEKLSPCYQPQTNYRWPKASSHPNPNISEIENQQTQWEKQLQDPSLKADQKNKLQEQITTAKQTIRELKHWTFLIGSADPFIVLPKFMLKKDNHESAGIGDYAVVLYQSVLYPAIVGDIGPSSKIGEASLRLCRAIEPRSGAYRRPVDEPHITYFVFPGSAEHPFITPDYDHWSQRCHELWKNLGGASNVSWHSWTKIDQPWPVELPAETNNTVTNDSGENYLEPPLSFE